MPCDFQLLPHEGIKTLSPYIPGKSIEELAREQGISDIIKLASNENPLGCSPRVKEALSSLTSQKISAYPDPMNHPLLGNIADRLGIDPNMITLGNGSDALFPLILMCFALHRDKEVLVPDYSFIAYRIYAKSLGIPVVSVPIKTNWEVDIDKLIAACHPNTALIFLANPNNPTGTFVKLNSIQKLLDNIPESTILVLDEAYHEYIEAEESKHSIRLLEKYSNLIITRTFSKAYGLAGLRVGYAIAHPDITSILLRATQPFALNQAGLAAALAALGDEAFIADTVQTNDRGLEQLKQGLAKLHVPFIEPYGNFVTINCQQDAKGIYQHLLRHGIIVRPLHPYGMAHFLRVTVGTSEQNKRFLDKLGICLSSTHSALRL